MGVSGMPATKLTAALVTPIDNRLPQIHPGTLSRRPMICHRVAKIGQLGRGWFCHTTAMTAKTIPEYLEDQRRNGADTRLRTEEEAARIQPLHHGHHRTPKPPKPELPAPVEAAKARRLAAAKTRKPVATKARKPAAAKTRKPVAATRRKPRAARKTGTIVRKMA